MSLLKKIGRVIATGYAAPTVARKSAEEQTLEGDKTIRYASKKDIAHVAAIYVSLGQLLNLPIVVGTAATQVVSSIQNGTSDMENVLLHTGGAILIPIATNAVSAVYEIIRDVVVSKREPVLQLSREYMARAIANYCED